MIVMNGTKYLTMKEMSEALGISYSTLDNWVRKGIIKPAFINPTGKKLFTNEQVSAYFNGEYSRKE